MVKACAAFIVRLYCFYASMFFIFPHGTPNDTIPTANERKLSVYALGIVYIEDGIITGAMLLSNTISVKICEGYGILLWMNFLKK